MSRLTIVLCSFILITSFACNRNIETIDVKDDDGNLIERYTRKKDDFAKEGFYTKYSPDGKVIETAQYLNDAMNGSRILYDSKGDTMIVETYADGKFEGPYRSYHANGALESQGTYVNGAMNGVWKYYYDNKQVKEVVPFVNNEEDGPFMEYHENGKLKAKGTYKTTEENIDSANREHGELLLYDENGELEKKMDCHLGTCKTTWTKEGKD